MCHDNLQPNAYSPLPFHLNLSFALVNIQELPQAPNLILHRGIQTFATNQPLYRTSHRLPTAIQGGLVSSSSCIPSVIIYPVH